MRPLPTTFPAYFNTYINLIPEVNLMTALINNTQKAEVFFSLISEKQSLYKYSEGKWTIKEILQHIIDTERIFSYRALSIARKETTVLPPFDEHKYSVNSLANQRTWKDLMEEFRSVRQSTILLFNSLPPGSTDLMGKINNYEMTVLALGFSVAGHVRHHMNIIRERYWNIDIP